MDNAIYETCLRVLSKSHVFRDIPSVDLERLTPSCTLHRHPRGSEIVGYAQTPHTLFVVGHGRAKANLPVPGSERDFSVAMYWPGDVFGDVAMFEGLTASSAVAVMETEIVTVPEGDFRGLLEQRPALAVRFIETLCHKLRTALEFTLALSYLDVPSRLYKRLHYFSQYDSIEDDGGIRIRHGLSQQELADSIGACREALNKILGEWKRAGLVDYGRGYMVILDPAGLAMRLPATVRDGVVFHPAGGPPDGSRGPTVRRRADSES